MRPPAPVSVIVEPVQGEAGVIVPPAGYLAAVQRICRRHDALLIVDEVQTGLGRLGTWWGGDPEGLEPDVMLVGKGLSGGVVPVAAVVATAAAYRPFDRDPFLHSSTFAGSPLAAADRHRRDRGGARRGPGGTRRRDRCPPAARDRGHPSAARSVPGSSRSGGAGC